MQRLISSTPVMALGAMLWLAAVGAAQQPEMAKPTKEHELLGQFAGEWDVTTEIVGVPGVDSMKCTGTESAKLIGGFWLVGQGQASVEGMPMTSVLTLGYNPATKKYIGTFFCSTDSTLWSYVGTMDSSGKKLTLETEGPSPLDPTKKAKYREILELKDPDHKTFTSYMLGDDGKLTKFVTMEYQRKK